MDDSVCNYVIISWEGWKRCKSKKITGHQTKRGELSMLPSRACHEI